MELEMTARRLTLLASTVAIVALVILVIDLGIKRSILEEAKELRNYVGRQQHPSGNRQAGSGQAGRGACVPARVRGGGDGGPAPRPAADLPEDRKSTRLNSSHVRIS